MIKKIGLALCVILVLMVLGFYIYTLDYYSASDYVEDAVNENKSNIETVDNMTVIHTKEVMEESVGLIFYPGGKVESSAYMPLLIKLSDIGLTCVLIDMPMNLAVFDINAADDVFEMYPEIDRWYIGGHSLGGAMASAYMEKHAEAVEGLILLGAYPVNASSVDTLAIYGTHDVKLDLDKVLLADEVYEIVDGNHANFGDYGDQEGDGKALISREAQQRQTVERIKTFIFK